VNGLVEFLRERLDEDERRAKGANPDVSARKAAVFNSFACYAGDIVFTTSFTPQRVLADVAAKRAIMDACEQHEQWYAAEPDMRHFEAWAALDLAVRHLAAAHAEHPDYQSDTWSLERAGEKS
jgi:hypothetical protein